MRDAQSLWIPFSVFGCRTSDQPTRAGIRVASWETNENLAAGAVLDARTFKWTDDQRLVPVPLGLYNEDAFGPLPRDDRGSVDLAAYQDALVRRPQCDRFGRIYLVGPVLHPWLARFLPERIAAATGLDSFVWREVLAGRRAVNPDGELVECAQHLDANAEGWRFGHDALFELAERMGRGRDIEELSTVPVLPAGLRPAFADHGSILVVDSTLLYQHVLATNAAIEGVMGHPTTVRERAHAQVRLQRSVDALLLDGLDEGGNNAAKPEDARLKPLLVPLLACRESIEFLSCATDPRSVLDKSLLVFRALVEASGLEIVPLTETGEVDEPARARTVRDRLAVLFQKVYLEQLGDAWDDQVMHGHGDGPHIDVHPFLPRSSGAPAMLVTAGMSTRAMMAAFDQDADPYVELVCRVPADLDAARRESLMSALGFLARHPFVRGTFFGPGHDISAGAPLVPGSALSAWTFDSCEEAWSDRLRVSLPRTPTFLRAIGLTAEELDFKRRHGGRALRGRMTAAGTWQVTDPRRS